MGVGRQPVENQLPDGRGVRLDLRGIRSEQELAKAVAPLGVDVVLGPVLGGSLGLEGLGPYASLVVAVPELPALATTALVRPPSGFFHGSPIARRAYRAKSAFERRPRSASLERSKRG